MTFDFSVVLLRWHMLVDGMALTAQLALITTVTGFIIGTACAIARRSGGPVLRRLATAYVESIRNTPFLVQIFVIYFGLSSLGYSFGAIFVAVVALTVNVGAYTAEIMRAGFDSSRREGAMGSGGSVWACLQRSFTGMWGFAPRWSGFIQPSQVSSSC